MAHDSYQLLISLALDGELEKDERQKLNHHLKSCVLCADTYERMVVVDTLFNVSPPAELAPPIDFAAQVMNQVAVYEERRKSHPWMIAFLIFASLLAALSVSLPVSVLVIGWDRFLIWSPTAGIATFLTGAFSALANGLTFSIEALTTGLTMLTTDPVYLGVVLVALVFASSYIGIRESMKLSVSSQPSAA